MKTLLLASAVIACMFVLTLGVPQVKQGTVAAKGDFNYSDYHNKLTIAAQRFKNGTNATHVNPELGVCYQEVLTASLVKDQSHIPPSNGTKPGYSTIRTCCPGYQRNPHNFRRCEPYCEQDCVNALCSAPNTCTCFPDHVTNLAGFCVPTCPVGCQNGVCDGDHCLCKPGFKLNIKRMFCEPICSNSCGGHGNCSAPETCLCESGFALGATGNCEAHCDNCHHGECVGAGQCQCFKGYLKNSHGECQPICTRGCSGGTCIAPDTCSCQYGFELEDNQCVPHCSQACLNGDCTGPNICTCNRGYIKDPMDPTESRCIPHCPGGCPNGVCSNPNYCICKLGYVKDKSVKGSQVCVRRAKRAVEDNSNRHLIFMIPDFDD